MQDLKPVSFKSILDFFKESTKTFFISGVSCAVILFAPDSAGLTIIRDSLDPYLKALLVVSIIGFIANISQSIIAFCRDKYTSFNAVSRLKKIARNLTSEEKKILRQYIENQTRVQSLNTADGVVSDLKRYGFIFESTNFIDGYGSWCQHNMTDVAWEYLNSNPHLLDHN